MTINFPSRELAASFVRLWLATFPGAYFCVRLSGESAQVSFPCATLDQLLFIETALSKL
jgi:hypothetical protein